MSFILEALKKSDRKRRRGEVPDLGTMHAPPPREPRRRALWPFLILTALLVNAALLIWWLEPWEEKRPPAVAPSPAAARMETPPRPPALPSSAVQNPVGTQPPQASAPRAGGATQTPSAVPTAKRLPPAPPASTVPQAPRPKSPPKQIPSLPAKPSSTPPPAAAEQPVTTLEKLPAEVRQGVPEMNISVHFYSGRPASRMVRINGRILREGDALGGGLTLEEITPEGMIFRSRGYRFQMDKPTPGIPAE